MDLTDKMEEDTAVHGEYIGFLDNFASEIGSTLDDLATDWNEDYNFNQDVRRVSGRDMVEDSSRTSSFRSQISMNSLDGMEDLSLKKARPLSFSNPVYDLVNSDGVAVQSRQMTLIPLNQFDINKPKSDSPTKRSKKHKKSSHGIMNKLSSLSMRRHSTKRHEPKMEVTAPLWTDVPSATYSEAPQRSRSLKRTPTSQEIEDSHVDVEPDQPKQQPRPASLEIPKTIEETEPKAQLKPPAKVPRTSKGSYSPLSPPGEVDPSPKQPDNVFLTEGTDPEKTNPSGLNVPPLELSRVKLGSIKSASSCGSLSSDQSEDTNIEDEQTTKTMLEVMDEVGHDEAVPEIMTQQSTEDDTDEKSPLTRNKTLKWSGSRAAPTLIREFTRKSKRNKTTPGEEESTQSVSVGDTTPTKLVNDDAESRSNTVTTGNGDVGRKVDKLAVNGVKASSSAPSSPNKRDSAFTFLSALLPPAPKLRRTESKKIRACINRMGASPQNALGYATTQFVRQTIQSSEYRPIVLLHSIRGFLTDIKRYLLTNPQAEFMNRIQKIAKHTVITDIEGAVDDALERLVLYPLRDHVYKCLVLEYARIGKIRLLEEAIQIAKSKTLPELGIRKTLVPPNEEAMSEIRNHFLELQTTYSPYNKLKHLLSAVTTIYQNTTDLSCEDHSARKIGADDFLPLLVLAIVKSDFTAADIEAHYIDGLLDPALLLGEGGYYLTTLISAVQVICSMKRREAALPNISDLQGFLKVGISSNNGKVASKESYTEEIPGPASDEAFLLHKTLHVPPSMTANSLGLMIARKYGMKQPKNFCLHVVVNGVAYPLKPQEFPQLVKMDLLTQFAASSFYFVYRRKEQSPEKNVTAEERPMTLDAEKLKVNTEDQNTEGKDEFVEGKNQTEGSQDGNTSDINLTSTRGLSPPSVEILQDVHQEVGKDAENLPEQDPAPITQEDFLLPPMDDIPTALDDLPPPLEDSQQSIDDFPPPRDDLPSPPAEERFPSPPVGEMVPLDTLAPPDDPANRSSDLSDLNEDSDDDLASIETYESGEIIDADIISTGGSVGSRLRNRNLQTWKSQTSQGGEFSETHPSFPHPIEEEEESDCNSVYDNQEEESLDVVEDMDKLSIRSEEPDVANEQEERKKAGNAGSKYIHDDKEVTKSRDLSSATKVVIATDVKTAAKAPSVMVTDIDPNNNAESENSSHPRKLSSSSDCVMGCHSDGRHSPSYHSDGSHSAGNLSDSHHSTGYLSEGHISDSKPILGTGTSVASLMEYFEDEITKVSRDATSAKPKSHT